MHCCQCAGNLGAAVEEVAAIEDSRAANVTRQCVANSLCNPGYSVPYSFHSLLRVDRLIVAGFAQLYKHGRITHGLPCHSWLEAAQDTLAVEQAVDVLLAQCATLSAYHLIDVDTESNL